jgi:TPR repeat protein
MRLVYPVLSQTDRDRWNIMKTRNLAADPKSSDDVWSSEPDLKRLQNAQRLIDQDPVRTIEEFQHLAALGSIKSMAFLGTMYRHGTDVEIDLEKSEYWYKQAADLGYIPAIYSLGLLYLKMKSSRRAVRQFEIGAQSNDMPSIYMLGKLHGRGQGTPLNPEKAKELWERGDQLGYLNAKTALGRLLLTGRFGLTQWFRGLFLVYQAIVLRFLIQRKNPRDERL